jgi:hypothetical protein
MPNITLAPKQQNFSKDPIWVEIEGSLFSAAPGGGFQPTVDNLSLYVQIWATSDDPAITAMELIAELSLPYSRKNKKVEFNLANMLNVYPTPPQDNALTYLNYGSVQPNLSDIAWGPTKKIQIKYNDMYGAPAELPLTLIDSDIYTYIYGSSPYWYGFGPDPNAKKALLHSYVAKNGLTAIKEIRREQPEFMYVYSPTASTLNFSIEVVFTDGTAANVVTFGRLIPAGISWHAIGIDQNTLTLTADPTKTVNLYIINVVGLGSIVYQLDDHTTEYDEYIIYDNGLGGCETLRCSGRHQTAYSVDKEIFTRAISRGTNFRRGIKGIVSATGQDAMILNTGYYEKEYIQHIRQVIIGEAWYIDQRRRSFEHVIVKDASIKPVDRSEDLFYVQFTIEFENRPSANTYDI